MSIVSISAVSLTSSLGKIIVPYIKVDATYADTSQNLNLSVGDQLGFSISGYVNEDSQYFSVLDSLSTSAVPAFDLIGETGSYNITLSAPTNNLYSIIAGFAAGQTPSGKNYLAQVMQQWQHPKSGASRFNTNQLIIIEGSNGIPFMHRVQLYEFYTPGGDLIDGVFSVSPPEVGKLGSAVYDVTRGGRVNTTPFTGNYTINAEITADLLANPYVPSPSDPYEQGGESDTGGGTGNFDGTSVDVDFTSLPTLSAADTGFISLYNPTLSQLQSLANYMWSDLFDIDTFKKLFGDPMQAILGLSIVPGPVPSAGVQTVKVGNVSTGVSMTKATSQYIDVDCGTLNVEEFWGAYLDYEPYTKAEIYLPYIGTHQIAVDDIMGKAVHIKYHIDILSGACAAEIKCGGSVLYTFIGSVAVSIPISGTDWTNVINGILSIAGSIGSMVATGGAAAPAAAGEIASAAVNSLKPNIEKSGSVSGGGGLMAGKVPVLILTRPRQALPASQNSYTGYPAFITRSLGEVSGYTEVHKIRLGGISATDAELDEIENLLKGGVIF